MLQDLKNKGSSYWSQLHKRYSIRGTDKILRLSLRLSFDFLNVLQFFEVP